MNTKIERVNKRIDKTKNKIPEFLAKLRELEKQKTEFENTEIMEDVHGMDTLLDDLPAILKALCNQGEVLLTSDKLGPKLKTKRILTRRET